MACEKVVVCLEKVLVRQVLGGDQLTIGALAVPVADGTRNTSICARATE